MRVSLVVPVYNEEQALGVFYRSVRQEASLHEQTLEIVFINDGSSDRTAEHARAIALADSGVVLINFSRNFGKEAALFAGLEYATGDAVIPMDVDLQDPVEVIPHLLAEWQKGADVVLAKRRDRSSDGYLKRRSASLFYHLLNRISYTHIEENVGDFRLMDRKVVDVIKALPEQQLFMKGVLSWAGFNVAIVEYDRAPRAVGQSKFNAWKLWNLALDGVTSFSTLPLRLWSYIGGGISLLALVYAGYLVVDKVLFGNAVPGYPSLMTAILFLGGVQLIGIGILGEYVGRIYMEAKHRPRYVVKDVLNSSGKCQFQRPDNESEMSK
ncbi:glycosyltransferase family 2 protein [Pseudomonas veronii]|jgi:polyisoprenyl-phosphate glycosyltransferase|uniref:Glycosyltransferase family 2 protein n=1 Tax=Pseudomonas veronii TaxID=76761 RepID=A0A0R3B599_PSEVE|nr:MULTISPECIES: glycosyltransferase family 2 protein [Pseudomonas]SEB96448.1 Glycosyltransferase involved in cell wall bisynthesis [Pseudomonas marginalis]KRP80554.1 bactoprenol glucosyl transferase [Pseudomonas veronii]MCT8961636.1 glycosyltransferase family 2 protein [Pseudomonas veronii]MCT9826161.1 glycosyltransferase family 2 protein [Pseudomonas veronii]NMX36823.1 glycosyltransferase family 2 protein [Pseudomonas veronii]